MNPLPFAHAVAQERASLIERWQQRFVRVRAAAGRPQLMLPRALLAPLLTEIADMVDPDSLTPATPHHRARVFAELAEFPASTLLVLDCYEAAVQALGAFIVENTGTRGRWDRATRNRQLGELDAVGRILAQRDIRALTSLAARQTTAPRPAARRHAVTPGFRFSMHQRN